MQNEIRTPLFNVCASGSRRDVIAGAAMLRQLAENLICAAAQLERREITNVMLVKKGVADIEVQLAYSGPQLAGYIKADGAMRHAVAKFAERIMEDAPDHTPGLREWKRDVTERMTAGMVQTLAERGGISYEDAKVLADFDPFKGI